MSRLKKIFEDFTFTPTEIKCPHEQIMLIALDVAVASDTVEVLWNGWQNTYTPAKIFIAMFKRMGYTVDAPATMFLCSFFSTGPRIMTMLPWKQ